jgi:hypothetical protein
MARPLGVVRIPAAILTGRPPPAKYVGLPVEVVAAQPTIGRVASLSAIAASR